MPPHGPHLEPHYPCYARQNDSSRQDLTCHTGPACRRGRVSSTQSAAAPVSMLEAHRRRKRHAQHEMMAVIRAVLLAQRRGDAQVDSTVRVAQPPIKPREGHRPFDGAEVDGGTGRSTRCRCRACRVRGRRRTSAPPRLEGARSASCRAPARSCPPLPPSVQPFLQENRVFLYSRAAIGFLGHPGCLQKTRGTPSPKLVDNP